MQENKIIKELGRITDNTKKYFRLEFLEIEQLSVILIFAN